MAFFERNGEKWFFEELYLNKSQAHKVKGIITDYKTEFQHLQVIETYDIGKILVLDGIIQTSTLPEMGAPYCEMLAHVPLITHYNPENILIIGGGDFEVAREVLKHSIVKKVDLVDIDPEVSKAIQEYMPELIQGTDRNPRLQLINQDGLKFLEFLEKKDKTTYYDIILVDSPDPIGPAKTLFTSEFSRNLNARLKPGGLISRQMGSMVFQPEEAPSNFRQSQEIFKNIKIYKANAPLYWGGDFTFLLLGKETKEIVDFNLSSSILNTRFKERNLKTFYYNPQIHQSAFTLPSFFEERLKTVYGWLLSVELRGCNLEIIKSKEKCGEFVKKLCKEIDMVPYGEFMFEDFGHKKSWTAGPSFFQFIETSSITGHISEYWDGFVLLEIFTCKKFDARKAFDFSCKFFNAKTGCGVLSEKGSVANLINNQIHTVEKFIFPSL